MAAVPAPPAWEGAKENFQPVKRGRNTAQIAAALDYAPTGTRALDADPELLAQRRRVCEQWPAGRRCAVAPRRVSRAVHAIDRAGVNDHSAVPLRRCLRTQTLR